MILISNIEFDLYGMVVPSNQEFEFTEDEGGGLTCEDLRLGLLDPVFASICFRHEDAAFPNFRKCEEMWSIYHQYTDDDGFDLEPGEGLLGYEFEVLCWRDDKRVGCQSTDILPVVINDFYGAGLDGFVTQDGHNFDTVIEAISHFVIN